ncbi:MAG: DUF3419 family protein [Bacilli bacterium]|nr:DUF3419 family protein [Bacilli bacterium]
MIRTEQREIDLENAINLYVNKFEKSSPSNFDEYSPYYIFTNEPLQQLIDLIDLSTYKKCLSVLSGGDIAFSLINAGFKQVDTFDINRLTEYFVLGFKKRAIELLSYEQFLELFNYDFHALFNNQFGTNQTLENYVISNLDKDYKNFWMEYKYGLKEKGYNSSVFHMGVNYILKDIKYRKQLSYLNCAEDYKTFQKKLIDSTINFEPLDIKDIPQKLNSYDFIHLSNILDYSYLLYPDSRKAVNEGIKLLTEIYNKNLTSEGLIIITAILPRFISSLVWNCNYAGLLKKYSIKNFYEIETYEIKKKRNIVLK